MKLLVFDGNSILNRAYYAIRPLTNAEGLYTHGVYGFLAIFYKELEAERPDAVAVAFDLPGPTFRHERFEAYKAHRKGMPEELAVQLPVLKEVLGAMRVCQLELPGYEADDIIGTLAERCDRIGDDCVIVTGDKDDLQLVSDRVTVKLAVTKGGVSQSLRYDPALVQETYGFEPARIVDLKALMGDPSDNIPGVPGVGEKTALSLLQRFGSLEAIYGGLETLDIRDSLRKKLAEGRELATLSQELAQIHREVPVPIDPQALRLREPDQEALLALFRQLEFASFAARLQAQAPQAPAGQPAATPIADLPALEAALRDELYVAPGEAGLTFASDAGLFALERAALGPAYPQLAARLLGGDEPKTVEDAKSAMTALAREGLPLAGLAFDPALASYLINPSSKHTLEALCAAHLDRALPEGEAARALALRELRPLLADRLEQDGLTALMQQVELPLSRVLSEMEQRGFSVDEAALRRFGETLKRDIAELEEKIYAFVGPFNLNSPKQLGEVLFERLGLPPAKKTKTGYSTDAETLERLREAHPMLPLILEYRKLTKLNSTYVDGFLALVQNGRIHTTFHQTLTLTGRLSSAEPNLQNIPVREPLGRELRRMFVAGEGCTLIDADYSQIELRVLAHIAQDETMTQAFRAGADIHTLTASQVFGVSLEAVTPAMRRSAKAVNFGIVYGISDFSLAGDIGVSRAEARRYIDSYFATYPGIRRYLDRVVQEARERGYVTTLLGRRRYLPELTASNFNQRSFGERAAMNTPIQGTAADIIKLAMVRVSRRLEREGLRARLVLQVHDELLLEAPLDEVEAASRAVREEMEGAMTLLVPLSVDLRSGKSWYDAH
ncbi:MAG: DNA polymerase I [Clostridiales bacterium]|nr:DNA polymerase I [Clostridiales bacterium]